MSWESLKAAVSAVITDNANNEITGEVLRTLFNSNVIDQLGANLYKGVATPATAPGTPENEQYYITSEDGIYANFNGLTIANELVILKYTGGTWVKDILLNKIDLFNNGAFDKTNNIIGATQKTISDWIEEQGYAQTGYLAEFIEAEIRYKESIKIRDAKLPLHRLGIADGQSNALAREYGALKSASNNHFMTNGGSLMRDFAFHTENAEGSANYSEYTSLIKYENTHVEGGHGVGYGIGAMGNVGQSSFFHRAIGSRSLEKLFTFMPRANLYQALRMFSDMIRDRGEAPAPDFSFTQGEAEMAAGESYEYRLEWFEKAIIDIQLACAWGVGNPNYIVKVAYNQFQATTTTENQIPILKADLDSIKNLPNVSVISIPYDKPIENDRVHFKGWGMGILGQSQAMANENDSTFYEWEKPTLQASERDGNIIEVFHRVTGGHDLIVDTSKDFAESLDLTTSLNGYQYYRNGAYQDLTGAALSFIGSRAFITLPIDPGAILTDERLDYGMQGYGGTLTKGAQFRCGGKIRSTKSFKKSSTISWQKVSFENGRSVQGTATKPNGYTMTGDNYSGVIHHTFIESGNFIDNNAVGYALIYQYDGVFVNGETIASGTAYALDLTSNGEVIPFEIGDWLARGSVQITEK